MVGWGWCAEVKGKRPQGGVERWRAVIYAGGFYAQIATTSSIPSLLFFSPFVLFFSSFCAAQF